MIGLDAIKARAEAATPGPWGALGGNIMGPREDESVASVGLPQAGTGCAHHATTDIQHRMADATFIAHARTDVPELVAEIERLRSALVGLAECHTAGEVRDELLTLAGIPMVVEVDGAYL